MLVLAKRGRINRDQWLIVYLAKSWEIKDCKSVMQPASCIGKSKQKRLL